MRLQKIPLILLTFGNFVAAQSPPGVFPQVLNLLLVNYGGTYIQSGKVVSAGDAKNMPQLGLPTGQSDTSGTYLMMMLDIDQNGANFKKRQASSNQPEDSQHENGQDTYLQAMIQDFTINTQASNNGSPSLHSNNAGPAPYLAPKPVSPDGHRYMILLFEQPPGWSLPSSLKQAVSQRTNFDIRNFMSETGFSVPNYSNWMIISPDGRPLEVSTFGSLTTLPAGGPTITIPVTTTVPVSGAPSIVLSMSGSITSVGQTTTAKKGDAAPTPGPNFHLAGGAAVAGFMGIAALGVI